MRKRERERLLVHDECKHDSNAGQMQAMPKYQVNLAWL